MNNLGVIRRTSRLHLHPVDIYTRRTRNKNTNIDLSQTRTATTLTLNIGQKPMIEIARTYKQQTQSLQIQIYVNKFPFKMSLLLIVQFYQM